MLAHVDHSSVDSFDSPLYQNAMSRSTMSTPQAEESPMHKSKPVQKFIRHPPTRIRASTASLPSDLEETVGDPPRPRSTAATPPGTLRSEQTRRRRRCSAFSFSVDGCFDSTSSIFVQ